MAYFFRSIISLFILTLLSGCVKNEFTLEFSLPADVNGNYRTIYYASDKKGGMTMEGVAVVASGKGGMRCPTVKPAILYLYPSGSDSPIAIFAERGETVKISGKDGNPLKWTVEGNDINKQLSEWRTRNAAELEKNDPEATNSAVAKFITADPSSEIAPLLLLTTFNRNYDETLFRRLWNSLPDFAKAREWAHMAGRADIPDGYARTPAQIKSLAMRELHNGVDTLRPTAVKASLLFFWNNGLDNRRERFDSIKHISREFPDSASRLIADVCLDPDSLNWRAPLRSDSLSKVVRFWAPAGYADSKIMQLGVTVSPFFIVLDSEGHQRYRGDDQEQAFSRFRTLMKK